MVPFNKYVVLGASLLIIFGLTCCKGSRKSSRAKLESQIATQKTTIEAIRENKGISGEAQSQPQDVPESNIEIQQVVIDNTYKGEDTGPVFNIDNIRVNGDQLNITVNYSGGCETHHFQLISNRGYMKTHPPKLRLYLKHGPHTDSCRELVKKDLVYDIKAIQYPASSELMLSVNDYPDLISYTY